MHPAETAQASADLNAKAVVPGHNGRFVLAKHTERSTDPAGESQQG